MAKLSIESRISKAEKTAEFYDKKARKLWAQAKNGGKEQWYCFGWARDCFERAEQCRNAAKKLRKPANKNQRERDK
ncbi:MAG: hypothetical protein J1F28_10055 [Oscillospiraceae bacterium]|nr:hypothetical protein [Oscillospiraceae bacterium]